MNRKIQILLLIFLIIIIVLIPLFINLETEHFYNNVYKEKEQKNLLHKLETIIYGSNNRLNPEYNHQLTDDELVKIKNSLSVINSYDINRNKVIQFFIKLLNKNCVVDKEKGDHILGRLNLQHNVIKNSYDYFELVAISIKQHLDQLDITTDEMLLEFLYFMDNPDKVDKENIGEENLEIFKKIAKSIENHWYFADGLCETIRNLFVKIEKIDDIEKDEKKKKKEEFESKTWQYFVNINKML